MVVGERTVRHAVCQSSLFGKLEAAKTNNSPSRIRLNGDGDASAGLYLKS